MTQYRPVYIEQLTSFSLLAAVCLGGWQAQFFYGTATLTSKNLAKRLYDLKFLKYIPQEFVFSYGDMRDPEGYHLFEKINRDLITLASQSADSIAPGFYKDLGSICDQKRLNLFFYKVVADRMHNTLIFLHALYLREGNDALCVLPLSAWARVLRKYGAAMGLRVSIVPSFAHHPFLQRLKKRVVKKGTAITEASNVQTNAQPTPTALIGACYNGRTLGGDPSKRNELFWLKHGEIDPKDVLLYFQRKEVPPTSSGVESMQTAGVHMTSFFPLYNNVPLYEPSPAYTRSLNVLISKVIFAWIKSWLDFKPVDIFFVERMGWFIRTYTLWEDFFKKTGIKINLYGDYMNPAHIAINQALRAQGGINVVYQWSHLHFHSAALALDTDVFYAFSNAYRPYMEKNRSIIKEYVAAGYPWDMGSWEMKISARHLRDDLTIKGATFIVCYLDENSSDDKYSIIAHQRARSIYAFLLTRVLEDITLGLILKPGYIHDFNERIADHLKELFASAAATGRLKIIGDGHFKTDTLPAEASSAADVTIGLLLSGTAVLEAVLTGAKAVFLDLEGLGYKDIYQWGRGSVVFESCALLWEALCCYRDDPKGFSEFGDLSQWVEDQKSYADSCGADRIAAHIAKECRHYRKDAHAV